MKKVKKVTQVSDPLRAVVLEDFSLFEAKMTKIKYLKTCKQNLDKIFIAEAIDKLELGGKKITPGKVKKICKKALINMIEEVER